MLARSAFAPRHKNRGRPAEKSAPGYLQWLRGRSCLCASPACQGRIEAAHVDYAGEKGMGTKVADRWAIPLCSFHHARQHQIGWATFDRRHLGSEAAALSAALDFWKAWPGRRAWEERNG